MIGTDRYAYASKLRDVSPRAKMALSALCMGVCLWFNGFLPHISAIVLIGVLLIQTGGLHLRQYIRVLCVPLPFLLLGAITLMLTRCEVENALCAVAIGQQYYGITSASLSAALQIVFRALGIFAAVSFTVLTTPATDLFHALRKLHVPKLIITLMELIYRFLFVVYESAAQIRTAQTARLGYQGLRRSFSDLGHLASSVLVRAIRRSDALYIALESRGYQGDLCLLNHPYQSGRSIYGWAALVVLVQLAAAVAERRLFPL